MPPDNATPNSVMLFDELECEKQNNIRSYFSMGWHMNMDSFYLCQTYTRIPKHLVRDNAKLMIIFNQDEMNSKHIYNDHVGGDMGFNDFYNICRECWNDKYVFLLINKDDEIQL